MAQSTSRLKRTPLYAAHQEWGAKMTAFGGWELPLQYTGIRDEHQAVRHRVGLFDISHMGQILVAGPNAERVLNFLLTNDVRKLAVGQGQYSFLCREDGGIVDDLIFYRVEPTVYLLVVNASRVDDDFVWMNARAPAPVVFDNITARAAAFAVQGPRARLVLPEAAALTSFHIQRVTLAGQTCWAAATGYTGEDGFELLGAAADAPALWSELLKRGQPHGLQPCGLGARDLLRLEVSLLLYGNDISEETTPLEANHSRFVAFDKGAFIGREALLAQQANGVSRKLISFKMTGKSPPPRPHYPIVAGHRPVGEVTSGTQSPSLGCGIGLGYVATALAFLFPSLERTMRRIDFGQNMKSNGFMQFRCNAPSGVVNSGNWAFHPCVDGQMGNVIQAYRDWQISGDDAFLRDIWPNVKKALEYAWTEPNGWDPNKDGVMEGCQHNFRNPIGGFDNVQRVYALQDEAGLLLCSWPHGNRPALPFVYSDEVWTGIEYQVAAHLIYEGLVDEGLRVVKAARDRHDGVRRNPWNEFECGWHYARALSSWAVLQALSGVRYSAVEKSLTFNPKLKPPFKCVVAAGTAWGLLTVEKTKATFEVRYGRLALRKFGAATLSPERVLTVGETVSVPNNARSAPVSRLRRAYAGQA
ncbi:MAG: glycine cleavage system aminomethyltransferase GcvT [Acidobacteria bacterium]|nr:glycine cleavage system aminomethyltransferase GcvT [Acidobacteriota bacterium]